MNFSGDSRRRTSLVRTKAGLVDGVVWRTTLVLAVALVLCDEDLRRRHLRRGRRSAGAAAPRSRGLRVALKRQLPKGLDGDLLLDGPFWARCWRWDGDEDSGDEHVHEHSDGTTLPPCKGPSTYASRVGGALTSLHLVSVARSCASMEASARPLCSAGCTGGSCEVHGNIRIMPVAQELTSSSSPDFGEIFWSWQ